MEIFVAIMLLIFITPILVIMLGLVVWVDDKARSIVDLNSNDFIDRA